MKKNVLTYSLLVSFAGWAFIIALFVGFHKVISIQPFGMFLLFIITGISTGTAFRKLDEQYND